jgi:hypothetical protein
MKIDYTGLLLGKDPELKEGVKVHVPTVGEITDMGIESYSGLSRPFVATIRELFSASKDVDEIEKQCPTLWMAKSNEDLDMMCGKFFGDISLTNVLIRGMAFWLKSEAEDFEVLSNGKIVNRSLNLVVDEPTFNELGDIIAKITLHKTNDLLIAPRNMSEARRSIWEKLYEGRLKKLKNQKGGSLGDKILILSVISAGTYSFSDIVKLTYFQFESLLKGYLTKQSAERNWAVYTAYKFDTKEMKFKDWTETLELKPD